MLCFACGSYNIVLTCHIYTHANAHTHTHTHAHTHIHIHTLIRTHTDLNFAIFWKDCEIKYRSNLDNAGLRNLTHRNSFF